MFCTYKQLQKNLNERMAECVAKIAEGATICSATKEFGFSEATVWQQLGVEHKAPGVPLLFQNEIHIADMAHMAG